MDEENKEGKECGVSLKGDEMERQRIKIDLPARLNKHNCPALTLVVDKGMIGFFENPFTNRRQFKVEVSNRQWKRIKAHFCGIAGCRCLAGSIIDHHGMDRNSPAYLTGPTYWLI